MCYNLWTQLDVTLLKNDVFAILAVRKIKLTGLAENIFGLDRNAEKKVPGRSVINTST